MTNEHAAPLTAEKEQSPGAVVGAALREAREHARMSVDDISAQLKLAPRQIRALEEGAYDQLPSKAFVRGFIRNYARVLHLDGDALMSQLDAPTIAPMLGPIAPTRGELPQETSGQQIWKAWALPAVLVAVLAVGAYYEWSKPPVTESAAPAQAPAAQSALNTAAAPSMPAPALPAQADTSAALPAAASAPATAPSTVSTSTSPPAAGVTAEQSASPPVAAKDERTETKAAATAATLELTFVDRSWVEVRDRAGHLLLTQNNPAGSQRSLSGEPPFKVVIGNANNVKLVYKGKPVNLAPHSDKNVARLTLN